MKKNITLKYGIYSLVIALSLMGCGNEKQIEKEKTTEVETMTQEMTTVSDEQKKLMAEGEKTEVASTAEVIEEDKNILTVGDYDIAIKAPKQYTVKSKDVTYGELVHDTYYSTTCEKDRKVNILLPANYSEEKKYPVLYVLHGIFGDENSMCGNGQSGVPVTLGNMMNEGLAKEMIVVFPYMYASKTQDQCTAINVENTAAYDNFINDLVNDLMPYMEANYSIAVGKENTAITGFSMGGRESLAIGIARPDLFGYIGSISAAPGLIPGKDWAMEHPGQYSEEQISYEGETPFLIMVCCGDKDSVVGTFPMTYHEVFDKNGVEHVWWIIPGSDHGDPAITSGIYNFAKEIFK